MEPILDIRDVSFAYRRDRPALEGLTLSVPRGTTLGVIGPNGAGKTTLLKLILGLLEPTKGTIRIDGQPPRRATRAGIVGYLPQNASVAPGVPIDARQLVTLGLAGRLGFLQSPARDELVFVDELLDRVGLAKHAHLPINALSGGQLQRALIARAVVSRPKLLLLDEPTIGIDHRGQQQFIELIGELKRALDLTVLFVSHDLRAVTSISDRIACVAGHVHFHDVPQHVPADLVFDLFACDLDALGLGGKGTDAGQRLALTPLCADPACDGHHLNPLAPLPAVTQDGNASAGQ